MSSIKAVVRGEFDDFLQHYDDIDRHYHDLSILRKFCLFAWVMSVFSSLIRIFYSIRVKIFMYPIFFGKSKFILENAGLP